MNTDTPTPRTDAAIEEIDVAYVSFDGLSSSPEKYVSPDFARQLERELAAVTKERDEAKQAYETHLDGAVKLRAERDQLRASHERLAQANDLLYLEVEALRKDKNRLDWLEAKQCEVDYEGGTYIIYNAENVLGGGASHRAFKTLRAAIDAAAGFKPSNDGGKQP